MNKAEDQETSYTVMSPSLDRSGNGILSLDWNCAQVISFWKRFSRWSLGCQERSHSPLPTSDSGEIGSWGLKPRILDGAIGSDKNDGCSALSRLPLIPWACFCGLCFSRSAPLTLFEQLPWVTKFPPPGHLHAPSAWVAHARGSPVLLSQVGTNPEAWCLTHSFIWDQAETGTFPKTTPCSIYSPSSSYFLHSLTSVFWEHFLCNVLHMTWMAHKSSSWDR